MQRKSKSSPYTNHMASKSHFIAILIAISLLEPISFDIEQLAHTIIKQKRKSADIKTGFYFFERFDIFSHSLFLLSPSRLGRSLYHLLLLLLIHKGLFCFNLISQILYTNSSCIWNKQNVYSCHGKALLLHTSFTLFYALVPLLLFLLQLS